MKTRGKTSRYCRKVFSRYIIFVEQNPGPVYAPPLQGPSAVVMQPMSQMKDFPQSNMQY